MTFGTRTFHVRRHGDRPQQDAPSWRIFPRTHAARERLRGPGAALPAAAQGVQRRLHRDED